MPSRSIQVAYDYNPKRRDWADTPFIGELTEYMTRNVGEYQKVLARIVKYVPNFKAIALATTQHTTEPVWANSWIPGIDAMTLYGMVAERNPKRYVEIGSGNSTKFVRRAIRDHGLQTKIISIDPHPRHEVDSICDEIIRKPCEEVDPTFFQSLTSEDVLFVDNSHTSFMNSDVTVFFSEILPALPRGLLYGLHDILLPEDYSSDWVDRWYNEQYLLLAYLMGGGQGDKILFPTYYMSVRDLIVEPLRDFFCTPPFDKVQAVGGIFWMEKNKMPHPIFSNSM